MWLRLELDGIELHFRILNYEEIVPDKWDEQWCDIDLTLHSNNWLHYQISSRILLSCEVDAIRNKISDLLNDKITAIEEVEFVEPDLAFVLHPKKDLRKDPKYTYVAPGCEILDTEANLHIHFWNGGLTDHYLSLCLVRNDLEHLLIYLQLVTHGIQKEDKAVQELVAKKIIQIC